MCVHRILDPATDNSTELRKALDEMTASKDCPIDPESQVGDVMRLNAL